MLAPVISSLDEIDCKNTERLSVFVQKFSPIQIQLGLVHYSTSWGVFKGKEEVDIENDQDTGQDTGSF